MCSLFQVPRGSGQSGPSELVLGYPFGLHSSATSAQTVRTYIFDSPELIFLRPGIAI